MLPWAMQSRGLEFATLLGSVFGTRPEQEDFLFASGSAFGCHCPPPGSPGPHVDRADFDGCLEREFPKIGDPYLVP